MVNIGNMMKQAQQLQKKMAEAQEKLNEIHGSLWDPTNKVVPMNGNLKTNNYNMMCEWDDKADLVLALGTSMSGLNSDNVAEGASNRAMLGLGLGLVIINF